MSTFTGSADSIAQIVNVFRKQAKLIILGAVGLHMVLGFVCFLCLSFEQLGVIVTKWSSGRNGQA